ncbi:uncharacterized protein LOC129913298 isoform X2 [Episyrphus balteatus]|uniref:uncharacterized protein LOC129913298 isoform X2 n=1 Tax=Episyrphus balteatus TaxID=286459 RepID=UPI00248536FA|nr:uncharacterized protein LOC129913298 isoform X2 [Episyrphus balteatus]
MIYSYFLPLTIFACIHSTTGVQSFQHLSMAEKRKFSNQDKYQTPDCGSRPARRQPRSTTYNNNNKANQFFYNDRIPKIIAGSPTKEGQFPWQVSLELLHPSMGFLGHWCGGVLIHQYWILSAAHCVHNDLFNLPLPPLWTVVLGEYNRVVESGYEQRIPVEKIVLHKSYHNFLHDLVLMKLSVPADLTKKSNIRRICLPFIFDENVQSSLETSSSSSLEDHDNVDTWNTLDKMDNFLRSVQTRRQPNITLPSMKELLTTKIMSRLRISNQQQRERTGRMLNPPSRRRNDKFMRGHFDDYTDYTETGGGPMSSHDNDESEPKHPPPPHLMDEYRELPFIDCVATGWGKSNITGDLTDILLKTNVPLHHNGRCKDAYGSFVKIHRGHLCAGKLNGKGGTCVGDSGGPLQCRVTKNGPWILAGITSFGSGCALEGFPDVYTRTSYYMKWISDTIQSE